MRDAEIRFVSVEWCKVWVRTEPSLTSGGSEELKLLRLLLASSEFRPGASAQWHSLCNPQREQGLQTCRET